MLYYIVGINIISFCLYGIDKFLAVKKFWRISEKCLLLFSIFGGVIGSVLAMLIFHHKTKKIKFKVNYVILVVFIYIIKRWYI